MCRFVGRGYGRVVGGWLLVGGRFVCRFVGRGYGRVVDRRGDWRRWLEPGRRRRGLQPGHRRRTRGELVGHRQLGHGLVGVHGCRQLCRRGFGFCGVCGRCRRLLLGDGGRRGFGLGLGLGLGFGFGFGFGLVGRGRFGGFGLDERFGCGRFCGGGRGQLLHLDGGRSGLELGTAGEASPERDDLLGRRFPAPGGEQELLGEGPQVHRVGPAPGQRVARQRQRGADRQQAVGARGGHAGAGGVEGAEFLPAHRRVQELCRDAPQGVPGPGEVVGPHRNDHGGLVRGRDACAACLVAGDPGAADHLGVRDRLLGHGLGRRHPEGRIGAEGLLGLSGDGGRLPHCVPGLVLGHDVLGHDDPRVLVAERLVEYGGTLAVPGLLGLADGIGHGHVEAVRGVHGRDGGPAGGVLTPSAHDRHQEPEAGGPREQHEPRDDVHDVAGRVGPVADAGAGVGPVRRQGQLGRAEQQHDRCQPADSHQNGERIPEGHRGQAAQGRAPIRGLADGRASDAPSPGGRFDTSDDSTGLAGSSTSENGYF